ncbi:MAG: 30S ribosomal protein S5 [Candidatus Jorgensenbacteria bacterium]
MRPPIQRKRVSEYKDRLLEIRRVTRVMAGGKRFSFRATVVVGNLRGKVGVGVAKGVDVMSAVEKARRQAEKRLYVIPLVDNRTIPHMVEAKFGAARVRIKPAAAGHGLIAGGAARAVLELAGVRDVSAKILGRTKNKISNAMVTLAALSKIRARDTADRDHDNNHDSQSESSSSS